MSVFSLQRNRNNRLKISNMCQVCFMQRFEFRIRRKDSLLRMLYNFKS